MPFALRGARPAGPCRGGGQGRPLGRARRRRGPRLAAVDGRGDGARLRARLVMREKRPDERREAWYAPLWTRVRPVILKLAAASFVINVLGLATPLFMMLVLNRVIGREPSTSNGASLMTVLCAGMLVAYGLDFALRVARGWLSARTGARLDTLMSAEVLHHLMQLPYRHFERTPSGVIAERLRQLDVLRSFFTGQMPVLAIDIAFVALFLAATFAISATLWASSPPLAIPMLVGVSLATHRAQRRLADESFQALAAKSSTLERDGRQRRHHQGARARGRGREALAGAGRAVGLDQLPRQQPRQHRRQRIGLAAARGVAGDRRDRRARSRRSPHDGGRADRRQHAGHARPAADAPARGGLAPAAGRRRRLQAHRRADGRGGRKPARRARARCRRWLGDIVFERVTYRADDHGAGDPAATPISRSPPARSWASSDLRARARPRSPISSRACSSRPRGRVLVDGTDIAHISPAQLRAQIGCVPQDVQLFTGSVRENIAMGVVDKDPGRVVAGRQVRRRARFHPAPAAGLQHRAGRARPGPVDRPAPASLHRPRADPQSAHPDPRRGDQRARSARPRNSCCASSRPTRAAAP